MVVKVHMYNHDFMKLVVVVGNPPRVIICIFASIYVLLFRFPILHIKMYSIGLHRHSNGTFMVYYKCCTLY